MVAVLCQYLFSVLNILTPRPSILSKPCSTCGRRSRLSPESGATGKSQAWDPSIAGRSESSARVANLKTIELSMLRVYAGHVADSIFLVRRRAGLHRRWSGSLVHRHTTKCGTTRDEKKVHEVYASWARKSRYVPIRRKFLATLRTDL